MKSIFKAVALITIFSIITRCLGFVFRIYLSRKLGAEALGVYQVAYSVIGVLITLVSSGLPLTTAKIVAKYEVQNEQKRKYSAVTASLIIGIAVAATISLIVWLGQGGFSSLFTDKQSTNVLITLLPAVIFSAVYSVFRGAMWGKNNYFGVCITEFAEQLFRVVITIIMLHSLTDTLALAVGTAKAFTYACAFSALLAVIIYFRQGDRLHFSKSEYIPILKSASPITGIRVASSFIQPISALIIPAQLVLIGYTKSEAVAAFGVMMGMTFPLLYVPMAVIGSVGVVLIPNISTLIAKNEYKQIESNISKSFSVSIFCAMLFVPLYLSVGDLIGIVLYDNAFSGILLQLAAVNVMPIAICNMTGSILNAMNLEVKSFVHYLIGALAMLISLFGLTRFLGINALVIALFLCMTIISVLNIRLLYKTLPDLKLNVMKTLGKYALIVAPSALLGYLLSGILINYLPVFVTAILAGGISVLFTLLLANVFNVFKIEKFIVLKKFTKKKRYN